MHIFLPTTLVFALLYSADNPNPHFEHRIAQNRLIHRTLDKIPSEITRGNAGTLASICEWKSIECTDGFVTSICLAKEYWRGTVIAEVDWLPPTVEFIHWKGIEIRSRHSTNCLPRALKYMYLDECSTETFSIDFARLPEKMEELILLYSATPRIICLHDLPPKMRFVYIRLAPRFIDAILVDYNNLPESLKELHVTDAWDENKIEKKIMAIGKPRGVKLQTKFDSKNRTKPSIYFERLDQKLR